MARNAEQNRQMRDQRREQILATGLRLFSSKGLAGTKIVDIAKESGISQGLLYHYFRSKEEIFLALLRTAFEKINNAALSLERMSITPKEKISLALSGLLKNMEESDDFARYSLLIAQASAIEGIPEEAKSIIAENREGPYRVMKRIMAAGQRDRAVKPFDAEQLSVLFWVLMKGLALHRAAFGRNTTLPGLEILTDLFFTED